MLEYGVGVTRQARLRQSKRHFQFWQKDAQSLNIPKWQRDPRDSTKDVLIIRKALGST
jgi:hypothetical protein